MQFAQPADHARHRAPPARCGPDAGTACGAAALESASPARRPVPAAPPHRPSRRRSPRLRAPRPTAPASASRRRCRRSSRVLVHGAAASRQEHAGQSRTAARDPAGGADSRSAAVHQPGHSDARITARSLAIGFAQRRRGAARRTAAVCSCRIDEAVADRFLVAARREQLAAPRARPAAVSACGRSTLRHGGADAPAIASKPTMRAHFLDQVRLDRDIEAPATAASPASRRRSALHAHAQRIAGCAATRCIGNVGAQQPAQLRARAAAPARAPAAAPAAPARHDRRRPRRRRSRMSSVVARSMRALLPCRIHAALEALAGIGQQAHGGARARRWPRARTRPTSSSTSRGRRRDRGARAAHDAGQADRPGVVGDHQHIAAPARCSRPSSSCSVSPARARAHAERALQPREIVGMHAAGRARAARSW